jgi:hypothetical protein
MLLGQMGLLAQDMTDAEMTAAGGILAGVGMIGMLIYLAFVIMILASVWKIFAKAGKPGWAAIIPIYNWVILLEIVGRPVWWIVLLLIPCVNIVIMCILAVELAKSFGKDIAFAIGLILLGVVFIPILGFGSAKYEGPVNSPA